MDRVQWLRSAPGAPSVTRDASAYTVPWLQAPRYAEGIVERDDSNRRS